MLRLVLFDEYILCYGQFKFVNRYLRYGTSYSDTNCDQFND